MCIACFCEIGFEYVIVDNLATCLSSLVPSPLPLPPFFPAQQQKWAGTETSVCHMSNNMPLQTLLLCSVICINLIIQLDLAGDVNQIIKQSPSPCIFHNSIYLRWCYICGQNLVIAPHMHAMYGRE